MAFCDVAEACCTVSYNMDEKWSQLGTTKEADAVRQLSANRNRLGVVNVGQAESLLRVLQHHGAHGNATVHALQLLARFAQQMHHVAQGLIASSDQHHDLLLEAVSTTVTLVEPHLPQSPAIVSAVILFLGTAVRALPSGKAPETDAVVALVVQLLDRCGAAIISSPLLEDVTAGIGHCLCSAQVPNAAAQWLLAALLAAWALPPAAPAAAAPQLGQLEPMWRLMQLAGHTLPRQPAPQDPQAANTAGSLVPEPGAVVARLQGLAEVVCSVTAEGTCVRAAAALLAAGGYMQGLRAAGQSHVTLPVLAHIAATMPAASIAALEAEAALASQGGPDQHMQMAALQRDAVSLAAVIASQAGPGEVQCPCTAAELRCQAATLLQAVTDLSSLLHTAVATRQPAEQAARAMQACANGIVMQHAGPLGSRVLQAYQHLSCDARAAVQQTALRAASQFAGSYASCSAAAPPGWLQQAEALGVRQVLDRAFTTFIPLLYSFWAIARGTTDAAGTAALVLDVLAFLHFARTRHGLYADLVQATLAATAASAEASRRLAAAMPQYEALTATPPGSLQLVWLADPALSGRVQFLSSMLAPCASQLAQADLQRLAPLALLHVQHPVPASNATAHVLFTSLLQAMHESQRERWAVAYASRALPAFPAAIDASRLAAALDAIAKLLPVGSLGPVLVARQVAARCTELLQQAKAPQTSPVSSSPAAPAQQQHPGGVQPAGGGGAADVARPAAAQAAAGGAALQLAHLLAHLLVVVDFHVLPDVMDAAQEAALAAVEPPTRHQVCAVMYDVLAGSDDYTRKASLLRWHQQLQYQVQRPQPQPFPYNSQLQAS